MSGPDDLSRGVRRMPATAARIVFAATLALSGAILPPVLSADADWQRDLQGAREALAGGDLSDARRRLQGALRRAESFAGDDWRGAGSRHNLGVVELARGDLQSAATLLSAAHDGYLRLFGATSAALAGSSVALGQLALARGELDAARSHFEQALNARAAEPGEAGAQGVLALLGLAEYARRNADAPARARWLEQATDRVAGAHLEQPVALQLARAEAALDAGRTGLAAQRLDDAEQSAAASGESGAQASVAHLRALLLLHAGNTPAALTELTRAVELWETGGLQPPGLALSLSLQAGALAVLGSPREAEVAQQRAVTLVRRSLLTGHPLAEHVEVAHVRLALQLGNPRDAISRGQQLLDGRSLQRRAEVLLLVAHARLATGESEAATTGLDAALAALPDLHPGAVRRAGLLDQAGVLLTALDRPAQAVTLHEEALELRSAQGEAGRRAQAASLLGLALARLHSGASAQARARLQALIELTRRVAPDSMQLAEGLRLLAGLDAETGAVDAAARLLDEASAVAERGSGDSSLLSARLQLSRGLLSLQSGRRSVALEQLGVALSTAQKSLPDRHTLLAPFITAVAEAQLALDRPREAAASLRNAGTARDAETLAAQSLLAARLEARQGRHAQADALLDSALKGLLDGHTGPQAQRLTLRLQAERAVLALDAGQPTRALALLPEQAPDAPGARPAWALIRATALRAAGHELGALQLIDDALREAADAPAAAANVDRLRVRLLTVRARALAAIGRNEEAIDAAHGATELAMQRHGAIHPATHPDVVDAELTRVAVLRQAGRLADATVVLERLRDALLTDQGEPPRSAAIAIALEAAALDLAAGAPTAAAAHHARALALLEGEGRGDHPQVGSFTVLRAQALLDAGEYSEAQALLGRLTGSLRRAGTQTRDSLLAAQVHTTLARLHLARVQLQAAENDLELARAGLDAGGPQHPLRAELTILRVRLALAGANWQEAAERAGEARASIDEPGALAHIEALHALAEAGAGRWTEALAALEAAREALRAAAPPGHPAHLTLAIVLAELQSRQGHWRSAEDTVQATLQDLEGRHPEPQAAIDLRLLLADIEAAAGRAEEAESVAAAALELARERHGTTHPRIATALRVHAAQLVQLGREGEAEAQLRSALDMHRQLFGDLHPETLRGTLALATLLRHTFRPTEAAQLLRPALNALQRGASGVPGGGALADVQLALAWARFEEGRFEAADELFRSVLEGGPGGATSAASDPSAGPRLAAARAGRAAVALRLARVETARTQLDSLLQAPVDLPAVALSQAYGHGLAARLALARGDTSAAVAAFAMARKVVEPYYPGEHPVVLDMLEAHARSWVEAGHPDEALALLRSVHAAQRRTHGEHHPRAVASRLALATAQLAAADRGAASSTLQGLDEVLPGDPDAEHTPAQAALRAELAALRAALLEAQGEWRDALTWQQRATRLGERARGERHPGLARHLQAQARVLAHLGADGEADQLLRRALALLETSLGARHPELIDVLGGLGEVNLRLQLRDSALASFERQLDLLEAHARAHDPRRAAVLVTLARLRSDDGDLPAAVALLRRAHADTVASHGPAHASSAATAMHLGAALIETGAHAEATQLYRAALQVYEDQRGAPAEERAEMARRSLAALALLAGDDDGAATLLAGSRDAG